MASHFPGGQGKSSHPSQGLSASRGLAADRGVPTFHRLLERLLGPSLMQCVHHAHVSPILALARQNIQARLPWRWLLPDGHAIKLNAGSFSRYAAS